MHIEFLADHPYLISEIAELKLRQFGYLVPSKTLKDFHRGLEEHLNRQILPTTYVFVEDKKFTGTVSLRYLELDSHQYFSPWMGSVLVHPDKRNQGIGTFLVKKAEENAKNFGFTELYLFTPDKSKWYAKLGWDYLEKSELNNIPIDIMRKKL